MIWYSIGRITNSVKREVNSAMNINTSQYIQWIYRYIDISPIMVNSVSVIEEKKLDYASTLLMNYGFKNL